jgi:hypothetical protein
MAAEPEAPQAEAPLAQPEPSPTADPPRADPSPAPPAPAPATPPRVEAPPDSDDAPSAPGPLFEVAPDPGSGDAAQDRDPETRAVRTRPADPALERVMPRLSAREQRVVAAERELTEGLGRAPSEIEIAEQARLRSDEVTAARRSVYRAVRAEHRNVERRRAARRSPAVHRIQPGESLWAIARAELGPRATNRQVATLVARVWEANARTLRSGDPDLIYPGERLEMPR